MSDKISYILEVLDGYSKETSKFKKELDSLNKSAKTLEKSLKSLNSALNFKSNVSQANKLSGVFSGFGAGNASSFRSQSSSAKRQFREAEQFSAQAVRSAEIISRNKRAYYQKMSRNEVDEMGWRVVGVNLGVRKIGQRSPLGIGTTAFTMGGSSSNSYSSPIRHKVLAIEDLTKATEKLNQAEERSSRIHRNSRRTFAGAYTPVRFDPYEGKYVGRPKLDPSTIGYGVAGLMGRGLGAGSIAAGLGFAGAAYTVGRSVKYVHDTTVQMDSLRASLSALIPNVKGLAGVATPESEINYIRGVSNKYGLNFNDIAPSYVQMLGTGGKTDASLARGLVESIGGYGGLLGMKGPAIQDTMVAFQQMLTKQTLQGQEVNLQTQQMSGLKPMLHEAFFNLAQKEGRKDITMENASAEFIKSMATGKLSSDLILRELINVINKKFGKEMIEKSFKMQGEKNRLSNAGQQLASTLGTSTYDLQIGAIRGLTDAVNQSVTSIKTIIESFKIMDNAFGDSKLFKIVKGMAGGLKDVVIDGTGELIKAPFKTASMLGEVAVAGALGEKELGRQAMRDWKNYYFSTPSIQDNTKQNNIPQKPQEVIVKITTENMPDFFSVQTSQPNQSMWRPSTVIAGQR